MAIIGAITLLIGAALVASTLVRGFAAPAYAASTPYELYCPGTPVGNIALNDVVTDGTITPASPASGQEFNLTGYQSVVNLPSSIVSAAAALGNSAITGTAVLKVDATGATPATVSAGTVPIDVPIPSPVPAVGLTLDLPSAPGTVGPFTAAGGPVTLSVDRSISLTISVSGSNLNLTCTPYANNSDPTGIASSAPSGSPISPVIATANGGTTPSTTTSEPGSTSTAPGSGTSPYELYCPGTPVGNIVLNDVVTDGTITPASPASGQQFSLTGFQSVLNLPSLIVSAAAALGNSAITGTAVVKVDATGATPASLSAGALPIDAPIPSPVPAAGLTLELPSTPGTVGTFTAAGGPITLSVDRSISLTISVSGSNLNLTCTPYPNNTAPTGITSAAPSGSPASPVIATANGGTTPSTTTSGPGSTSTIPSSSSGTAPYELYCPGTPVGNIVLNDVVTDGTITAASGQQFNLTGFQSVLTLPNSIVSAAAALGNSAITGTAVVKVDATGATPASLSAGTVSIDAPIPSPVPAAGLTLDLPSPPGTVGPFTATGGTVSLTVDRAINLTISVSGSNLNLTCTAYPDNTAPSGITSAAPSGSPASPVIATATSGGPPPTTTSTSTSTSTTATHTATAAGSTTTTTVAPGPPLALSTGSAPIQAGGTVTVTGSGFQPGEPVAFAVFSARVDVGTADADAEGDVTKAVTIPASLPSGTHTITATGETSGVVDTVSITVSAVSTSSTTGAPTTSSTTRAVPATTGVTPAVPSRALAFTGPGAPLRWLALAGALLVVLAGALCLAMAARRAVVLVVAPGASPPVSLRRRAAEFGALRAREARTVADWLLGRRR